jgi:hypothetical protein
MKVRIQQYKLISLGLAGVNTSFSSMIFSGVDVHSKETILGN